MAPNMSQSQWRMDVRGNTIEAPIMTKSSLDKERTVKMPDHQVEGAFAARHDLASGMRLTWTLDDKRPYSNIFTLSEVDTFAKIKNIIADRQYTMTQAIRGIKVAAIHVDRFIISFTDQSGRRISSEIDSTEQKHARSSTKYSTDTFNILMKATTARISLLHNYCVCNDMKMCEKTVSCPEIGLWLCSLDCNYQRIIRSRTPNKLNVDTDKVVFFDQGEYGLSRRVAAQQQPVSGPRLLIEASCLRRLLEGAATVGNIKGPAIHGLGTPSKSHKAGRCGGSNVFAGSTGPQSFESVGTYIPNHPVQAQPLHKPRATEIFDEIDIDDMPV